jgi:cell wall-associated NlpC family hydrolase
VKVRESVPGHGVRTRQVISRKRAPENPNMFSTTRTRLRSTMAGIFLAAAVSTIASPAAAAEPTPLGPVDPFVTSVVSDTLGQTLDKTVDLADPTAPAAAEAETLAAAVAAIPTETLPFSAKRLKAIEKALAKRSAINAKAKRSRGPGALSAARSRAGDPYRYGAAGPSAFDCSGLTQWAYARVGESLPHSSGAQVGRTARVGRPGIGDLVFFTSGGSVYHVGLYAGGGKVFHASRPGTPVGLAKIWTRSVFYGRVI